MLSMTTCNLWLRCISRYYKKKKHLSRFEEDHKESLTARKHVLISNKIQKMNHPTKNKFSLPPLMYINIRNFYALNHIS